MTQFYTAVSLVVTLIIHLLMKVNDERKWKVWKASEK